jgi:uncharacterized protein (UPF0147 family)
MTDHAATLRPLLLAIATDQDLPRTARLAAADAEGATDIEAVIARAGAAIVALESVEDVIANKAKALRAALLEVMVETGAPPISTGHHTISTAETRRVVITDEAAIPISLMRQPAPKPDTKTIRRLLLAGAEVPGAQLTNGTPSLTIRARNTK